MTRLLRCSDLVLCVWSFSTVSAQTPVPFVASDSSQYLFVGDRSFRIENTPARWSASSDGHFAYLDAYGDLKRYDVDADQLHLVDTGLVIGPQVFGSSIVYRKGDALILARTSGKLVLANKVGNFTVDDSVVVYHDLELGELRAYWKGRQETLAEMAQGTAGTAWTSGTNTVVFHDRSRGRMELFHRGTLHVLADSCDIPKVAAGGDMLAYVDGRKSLMLFDHGSRSELSPFLPVSFQAGDGIVAFVDMAGRLQAWSKGVRKQVSATMPSWYTVEDSMLLFVEEGALYAFHDGDPHLVENYLPEKWTIQGSSVTYLDLDRAIHRYSHGKRTRITKDGGHATFDVIGPAVLYRDQQGLVCIWLGGRTFRF